MLRKNAHQSDILQQLRLRPGKKHSGSPFFYPRNATLQEESGIWNRSGRPASPSRLIGAFLTSRMAIGRTGHRAERPRIVRSMRGRVVRISCRARPYSTMAPSSMVA